jgi:LCP family protein required for cell wall assembly
MTPPTSQAPDDLETRIADALHAARTDSRLRVQPWSDGPSRIAQASRRKRMHRASLSVTTIAALVLATVGGSQLYLKRSLNAVQTSSLAAVPGAPKVKGKGSLTAKPAAGQPFTVLILGTDSRVGTGTQYGTNADACQCSDTIILARVDPQTSKVSLLSVPRDSRVFVTGRNEVTKINSAFGLGPDNSVATIQKALQIDINHWVVLDLAGFKSIVDAIGGIKLDFPVPIKDKNAGLNVTTTGCQTVSGTEALAISRSRELQYLGADGKWTYDPSWENGRQRREQILMRVIAAHTVKSSLSNPITAAKVISTFTSGNRMAVDSQISSSELIDLAGEFAGFNAGTMQTFSLPTKTTIINGIYYEVLQPTADAATIKAWYAAVQPTPKTAAPTSAPTAGSKSAGSPAAPTTAAGGAAPTALAPTTAPTTAGSTAATTAVTPNQPEPFDPRPCS